MLVLWAAGLLAIPALCNAASRIRARAVFNATSTASKDVSFVPNVLAAQNGIHGAQLATDAIGSAVFANQSFDHELNNQFANNVSLAAKALEGIVTTDSTANSTLAQALGLLNATANAAHYLPSVIQLNFAQSFSRR
ncbi:hypothetical protein EWM64_g1475 [Hericium alpestre]|uniref:Uncharacterized protein n=1 Tax=Hericium alpestre TaxID=135208 RepID=A0A4Z0A7T1_9AGAM|nr:hypothetical protein EWM64_g1475 [Hericium alpestre]